MYQHTDVSTLGINILMYQH